MATFTEIQNKWQQKWADEHIFRVTEDPKKPKYYCLEMFPYPSGKLHMGHVRNYSLGDAFARYKRMMGFNVLYPMGYDAFGLPAENAAIKQGGNPEDITRKNIAGIKAQQKQLGLSYDWSREIATCNTDYYKWNQWIFLQFYKKGLVYRKKALVNWDPVDQTVLANEQVIDGKGWRSGALVEQREIEQWFFKITDYAQELLDELQQLPHWPGRVKIMQENWIGRSEGCNVSWKVEEKHVILDTFTTTVDTIYGVTFVVISPEHPKLSTLITKEQEENIKKYIESARKKSEIERMGTDKEKTGIFTGTYLLHPFTGKKIPLWVADYVLMNYGTGVVMGVPAHDQRDMDFAKKYELPILQSIESQEGESFVYDNVDKYNVKGRIINSGEFNGIPIIEGRKHIVESLKKKGLAEWKIQYKLRDWLISRQRYWGTPIPMIYCKNCNLVPVPEQELPVMLPKDAIFTGAGNPLETSEKFTHCTCPQCGGKARRETDTMDTFVDSSWYFLRYCSPQSEAVFDKQAVKYWMPVDQYIGGIEHACLHLIYARFFTKALRDLGLTDVDEPFTNLLCQGMVIKDGAKMSKSIGNVVDPGEIMEKFGADTARLFMLFAALPEKELDWSDQGVEGTFRFLKRVERLVDADFSLDPYTDDNLQNRDKHIIGKMHATLKRVTDLIEHIKFSLAIGAIMELVNDLYKYKEGPYKKSVYGETLKTTVLMLAPFAPHLCEELWERMGNEGFISLASWPVYDEQKIDKKAQACEELVQQTFADIASVLELAKITHPNEILLFVAKPWKHYFFARMQELLQTVKDPKEIMKALMADPTLKQHGQDVVKWVPRIMKDTSKLPKHVLDDAIEYATLMDGKQALEEKFGCAVQIMKESESTEQKAQIAIPGKAAILVK
ncbi:leucine--tRNA ligase [Candidatus Woesearchaeota archaeon]|nr:leucine--tRNA ligase [Candidatus Woesearchaeota archaeon]